MRRKNYEGLCTHPDRDNPELICGYPLPCPYHTVIIDTEPDPPTVKIPVTIPQAMNPKMFKKLKKIANVLKERINMSGLEQFRNILRKIENETNTKSTVYLRDTQLMIRQNWFKNDEEHGLEQYFDFSSFVSDEQMVDAFVEKINFCRSTSEKLSKKSS